MTFDNTGENLTGESPLGGEEKPVVLVGVYRNG